MNFKDWEPRYDNILNAFGFSKAADEKSTDYLSDCVRKHFPPVDLTALSEIQGQDVIICGNAPSLEEEARILFETKKDLHPIVIAADGAASVLLRLNRRPDFIVTDLDGKYESDADREIECYSKGTVLLVHAHGDNLDKLCRYLLKLKKTASEKSVLIPTCQCRPHDNVFNFGGFTDGDRCVFLADELGAQTMTLIGFDFEDPDVSERKKKKLSQAKKLIQMVNEKRIEKGLSEIQYFSKTKS
ncbi:6-hydroxymethylpterin diphosphokinase MptE-like protein [Methanolapillus millepedarum]|uniref:6-hydroxymethyl-7,8-dihydropterin pyrophosphokinase n=1 Tax=Methanolapillus millepedarum TaxID=3028296 RepID=A0AA96ZV31_9EURY|nr:hypothetical protein MsAc7_05130 [Methanosarcinaceae archaeon Ac7]